MKNWIDQYSKEQLETLTSSMALLAGLRPFEYQNGRVRGMRGIDGWTGSGLRFTLWPDRALDIGEVWFNDIPIAWLHPGLGAPFYYEPNGDGWLRTYGGGLLTTCGLTHFGDPDQHAGQNYGLHGRIANIPVSNLRLWQEWQEENYLLAAEGEVQQAVLFGENLRMLRRIETQLGSRTLSLKDEIINLSSRTSPLAVLYHCNLGFPILSPESQLQVEDLKLVPRDDAAKDGMANYNQFELPQPAYQEQVFFHYPKPDPTGYATATLYNPTLSLGVRLRWLSETMPVLTQWKMLGEGEYVCGLEPCTHAMGPREQLAKTGLPKEILPGEHVKFELHLTIIESL